jgi:hypothetical protein
MTVKRAANRLFARRLCPAVHIDRAYEIRLLVAAFLLPSKTQSVDTCTIGTRSATQAAASTVGPISLARLASSTFVSARSTLV